MIKSRMVLMKGGHTEYDFETEIVKPRIGELISMGVIIMKYDSYNTSLMMRNNLNTYL